MNHTNYFGLVWVGRHRFGAPPVTTPIEALPEADLQLGHALGPAQRHR